MFLNQVWIDFLILALLLTIQCSGYHYIDRTEFSSEYDARSKNPLWVYEHLTAKACEKTQNREDCEFQVDSNLPEHMRATLKDYKGSGFDRGHLAAAANHMSSEAALKETFYLTNVCPQNAQFNRGYWAALERHVRNLTKKWDDVYVITGPLYIPYTEENGNRFMCYQVIGPNDVAVPTHFFKVITTEKKTGESETVAFIFPNEPIEPATPFERFKTTVNKVERLSGIIFFNPGK